MAATIKPIHNPHRLCLYALCTIQCHRRVHESLLDVGNFMLLCKHYTLSRALCYLLAMHFMRKMILQSKQPWIQCTLRPFFSPKGKTCHSAHCKTINCLVLRIDACFFFLFYFSLIHHSWTLFLPSMLKKNKKKQYSHLLFVCMFCCRYFLLCKY